MEPTGACQQDIKGLTESINIKITSENQPFRAGYGAFIHIEAMKSIEEETFRMRSPFMYSILSNIEYYCKLTKSWAFQINFAIDHINTGTSFNVPNFEHVFEVVRFE